MKDKIIIFSIVLGALLVYLYFASRGNTTETVVNYDQKTSVEVEKATPKPGATPKTEATQSASPTASPTASNTPTTSPSPVASPSAVAIQTNTDNKEVVPDVAATAVIPKVVPVPVEIPQVAPSNSITVTPEKLKSATKIALPTQNEIVVYKPDDNNLECYSLLSDGNILLTDFVKKPWGTWNIQSWSIAEDAVIPSKNFSLLAGGGTEWEYVFRIAKKEGDLYELSGGNHGKESLINFNIFDGENDAGINLRSGESRRIKILKIVEKTALTFDDSLSDKYAEVVRTYNVMPNDITLKYDVKFTRDVLMGTSYVCMFPVEKSTGQYFWFKDQNHVFKSPGNGKTLTTQGFNNYFGIENTRYIRVWGENDQRYVYGVWIRDNEMVNDFKNRLKAFVWDMNERENKVYFSKYDNEYRKIVSGTTWHNMQGWNIGLRSK